MEYPVILPGLSSADVAERRRQYGRNVFEGGGRSRFLQIIIDIAKEPMFILLAIACALYFILGSVAEGVMMTVALALVSAISVYQEAKSERALRALQSYMAPKVIAIRDGKQIMVESGDLVPGDIILLEEGMRVPADATVHQSNDLSTDDSIITGESMPVNKNAEEEKFLYQGTTVNSGKCVAMVTATGNKTVLGKIGKSIETYADSKTLLQQQLNRFVTKFAFFGFAGFVVILIFNFLKYDQFVTSLLFALTVAMSVIPEEIPVAFSSFMALGAAKMAKAGIISRQPQVIENLGAVNILCLDKTGTLTENKMKVTSIYDHETGALINIDADAGPVSISLLWYAALASEHDPFDAMEKAIWDIFKTTNNGDYPVYLPMIKEYPLEGKPPMMTHVYNYNGLILAIAKGGAETILKVCKLQQDELLRVRGYVEQLAFKGYRVLGVAKANHSYGQMPESQQEFNWKFVGLLALYDAPRKNAANVIEKLYKAGIKVKLVTGDHPATASTIAEQSGFAKAQDFRTGEEIMRMSDEELKEVVFSTNIFARMFPEAKLKLINALKDSGNIVGMTGDGVNDGPALKGADIGIAMGNKGTETARRAADLVLTDDNLENIANAVYEGRKIFSNLVKAIRYIIAIHIPIILTASLPLLLGWRYPNIFSPVHVIFLELIMAPTCSIFFEREPVEDSQMLSRPRSRATGLFTREQLLIAIVQGVLITAGVLSLYYIFMTGGHSIEETRTVVFTTLLVANIFLTFTDRSLTKTIWYTIQYKNNLAPVVLLVSVVFLLVLHFLPAARSLFQLAPISASTFWLCIGIAFCSVMWYEVYKSGLRKLLLK